MHSAVAHRKPGILTYGITPPKLSYSEEKRVQVAARQSARIAELPVDGLVVYDLQDESPRTEVERPFPFLQCINPVRYAFDYLNQLPLPKVVYQCVAPHTPETLTEGLVRTESEGGLSVLVGAASRSQTNTMRLSDAYKLRRNHAPQCPLGGVLIAERHGVQPEDERIVGKMDQGCSFFITQAVYSVTASKNVLSDLSYRCEELHREIPPILITLSPCGSAKTLDFMRWLGVSVPRWMHNELTHTQDILQTSVEMCTNILEDLLEFSAKRGIPLGCNVESVSLRKEEIEASVQLVHRVARLLGK